MPPSTTFCIEIARRRQKPPTLLRYLASTARHEATSSTSDAGPERTLSVLAANGYGVTGVDVSPAMVACARAKIAASGAEGRHVDVVHGDVRTSRAPSNNT